MKLLREYIRSCLVEDTKRRSQLSQDLYGAGWRDDEMLPEPQGVNKSDKVKAIAKQGKTLKQAFAKNADRTFLNSLTTIHWVDERGLQDMLRGKVNSRDELSTSAYLPGNTKATGFHGHFGMIVKGHITLLANDMDQLYTGVGEDYTTADPERTKMSGSNKGIQQRYEPNAYSEYKIIVLDKQDWAPTMTKGQEYNEALVDNWTPTGIIIPDDSYAKQFKNYVKNAKLDIPVITSDKLEKQS